MPDPYAYLHANAHRLSATAYRTAALLIGRAVSLGRANYWIEWAEAEELTQQTPATLRNHLIAAQRRGILQYKCRGVILITLPPVTERAIIDANLQKKEPAHTPSSAANLHAHSANRPELHAHSANGPELHAHSAPPAGKMHAHSANRPELHAHSAPPAGKMHAHSANTELCTPTVQKLHAQRETSNSLNLDLEEEEEEEENHHHQISDLARVTLQTHFSRIAKRPALESELRTLAAAAPQHASEALQALAARWGIIQHKANVTRYLQALIDTAATRATLASLNNPNSEEALAARYLRDNGQDIDRDPTPEEEAARDAEAEELRRKYDRNYQPAPPAAPASRRPYPTPPHLKLIKQ